MTRARAVKAAMERVNSRKPSHRRCVCANCQGDIEREINHAFDEGRIAGMREAASGWVPGGKISYMEMVSVIRQQARALARKVRG